MLLYEETLILRPEQTKTNVIRLIDVPRDFREAVIEFAYEPKWVTDPAILKRETLKGSLQYGMVPEGTTDIPLEDCPKICNMVTFSMDINDRFCGYAHRHDPEQLIRISETYATPGFHKIKPVKGVWKLTLPVNNVSTDTCTCTVRVRGEE